MIGLLIVLPPEIITFYLQIFEYFLSLTVKILFDGEFWMETFLFDEGCYVHDKNFYEFMILIIMRKKFSVYLNDTYLEFYFQAEVQIQISKSKI